MLDFYIKNKLSLDTKQLHIFADNCAAQNKNRFLWAYLHSVVESGRLKVITFSYPIPGHSFLPCDRDFALIEKKRKKVEKAITPSYWVDLIRNAQTKKPFDVIFVEHPLTDDLVADATPVVKVKDYKSALDNVIKKSVKNISLMKGAMFTPGKIQARKTMNGDPTILVSLLKRGHGSRSLVNASNGAVSAFESFLKIKKEKYKDVMDLLSYVALPANVTFYQSIVGDDHVDENEGDQEEEGEAVADDSDGTEEY